ncbi:MAG: N-acetyl-gamma-glutamyl-phosphate reductase [Treponema sp.]|jgi:N-acetyl-gamma-glutamyl-phosphate reductase|nr:N-acetyl-gamma-glutamyl-phosphate reductase [Treponema sp.]
MREAQQAAREAFDMNAGIIGATGYAGAELVRLLQAHPGIKNLNAASVSFEGENIENIYPNFLKNVSCPLVKPEEAIARSDVIFSALPHGVGEGYAKACVERGISFIDLSADFRFGDDEALFAAWYGQRYKYPELRSRSVYGLPELNRARLRELAADGPVIVGNPGCYPTAASLGAFPALAKGLAAEGATIIVDAASGVTGGGREPGRAYHFPECSDSMSPYKVGAHRHSPEIRRSFAAMAGRGGVCAPGVVFTPHLAPMNRGILAALYIPLARAWQSPSMGNAPPSKEIAAKAAEIRRLYADFYKDELFVRVLPEGVFAATGRVRQSNFCDISVHLDQSGTMLIIESAIDNMVKGAAGQAVQNMNIVMGFEESAGLAMIPALF